ncbi:MAG: hotdog fold thioesterase [Chitinophagales bacterium]
MDAPIELFKSIIEEFIPFNKVIGFKLIEVKENFVSLLIPYKPELIGDVRRGSIHGGVIATAMDTVGGAAGITTLKHFEDKLSTIDLRVDYLAPGQARDIITEGHIIKSGNKIIFTRMIAYHDNPSHLIAEGRGVYNVIRVKEGSKI